MESMAAAPVAIAPILTPRTLSALAGAFEGKESPEVASVLKTLEPFFEGGVQKYFAPLSAAKKRSTFRKRFSELARDYEPFRIYLMFKLISLFQQQEFLRFYGRIFQGMLGPLLGVAEEMNMAPHLIAAIVKDYFRLFERVRLISADTAPTEMTFGQFSLVIECLRQATRFDYGVTAVFLTLERSIPQPNAAGKTELLLECRSSLVGLATSCVRAFDMADGQHFLDSLESPQLEVAESGQRVLVLQNPKLRSINTVPTRQAEVDWIKRNTEASDEHQGKWVVLEKDELVASDKDYGRARAIAKQRGIKRPFIVFIPSDKGRFMGI